MKGNLIVTGMVVTACWLGGGFALWAQDFTPSAPPARQSLGGAGNFGPLQDNLLGPLELRLDEEIVASLREDGGLKAPISPQDAPNINQVIFGFQGPLSGYRDERNFGEIEPVARTGGVLVFEFRESDLRKVQGSTLRYTLSREEIGQYRTVEILYRGASRDLSADRGSVGGGGAGDAFPLGRRETVGDVPVPVPANPNRNQLVNPPDDDGFARPGVGRGDGVRGDGGREDVPTMRPVRPPASDFDQSRSGAPVTVRPPLDSFDRTSPTRQDRTASQEWDAVNQKIDQLERLRRDLLQDRQEFELEKLKLADRERQVEQRARAAERLSDLGADGRTAGNGTIGRRVGDPITDLQERVEAVERQNRRLQNENRELSAYLDQLEANVRGPGIAGGTAGSNERWADRIAPNPTSRGGLEGMQASLPGTSNVNNNDPKRDMRNEKNIGVLYSLLIGSLGLNLYLAWISRSFYVRYGELADELRDAFASTN